MSIQLDVMEKCQNCPDFKPCELRPLCQELSDYIWSVLTKKLEEMGRYDKNEDH